MRLPSHAARRLGRSLTPPPLLFKVGEMAIIFEEED
jgi:hypothetical protein